jgi:hypothetical protein
MGGKFATIVGWMLGLVLAYLLLVHSSGTTSIIGSSASGASNVLSTLQGR